MSLARSNLPCMRGFLEGSAERPLGAIDGSPASSMKIIYSDEAGIGDEAIEPILVVAGVIIDGDRQWPLVESEIQRILDTYIPKERQPNFEFKASRLFGQLSKGNNDAILREFLLILETFQLPVPWGAVNRVLIRKDWESRGLTCPVESIQESRFRRNRGTCRNDHKRFLAE
jgi:hypothetical protein